MTKSRAIRLLCLLLLGQLLIGCAQPSLESAASSTAAPTPVKSTEIATEIAETPTSIALSPTPTSEPPVIEIVPVPLPTVMPDQAALLAQVAEEGNSVDFVIDIMELEDGKVPWQLALKVNWYKYTSPGGEFSSLMLSGPLPDTEVGVSSRQGYGKGEAKRVSSAFATPMLMHMVTYYDTPEAVGKDVKIEEFLDGYQFSDTAEMIEQTDIELGGYRGCEFVLRIRAEGEPDYQFDMRARVYVIEGTVFELRVTAVDPEEVFGANGDRFLDSFTPKTASD